MLRCMSERFPSDATARLVVRCGDDLRDRINALAKTNGRSANTEAIKALEAWVEDAERAVRSAHEVANELPVPERILGTYLIHVDAEGHVSNRVLLSEAEEVERTTGTHAVDIRIVAITPGQEAADPRKAKMAASVRRSRDMAEARAEGQAKPK